MDNNTSPCLNNTNPMLILEYILVELVALVPDDMWA